jgi:thiamine-phosphate pyrophosphorylase
VTTAADRCRLYLIVETDATAPAQLEAALTCPAVASVLIASVGGGGLNAAAARELVSMAQAKNVASVLWSDVRLARTLRADGVHLPAGETVVDSLREARDILGRGAIVGADAGISRHDAMVLAEAGADYIAFGLPAGAVDLTGARACRDDLLAWWAEIFEVPCVALGVETADEAATLARLNVDFVATRLSSQEAPSEVAARLRELAAAIAEPAAIRGK